MNEGFRTTEIGDFPPEWKINRVDFAFKIQQGKQVSQKNREGDNQHPFLRTKNILWNRLDLADLDQMNFTKADERRLQLCPNDLLTCEGGDIGRTALWNGEIEDCYYQNHLHRLRALDGKVDARFSVYWFWYAFQVAKLYFGRGNVTTIPNLSQSKLAELPMVFPPLPEQKKIAHVLSTVQRSIEAQEKIIQTTTELKKALLHKLFTEGTRGEPQKETEIGLIPESWGVCRISDAYSFTKKPRGFVLNKCGNPIPFFRMEQIPNGKVHVSKFTKKPADNLGSGTYVENGDMIIAKITPSFENEKQAIVDIDSDFAYATTEVIPLRGIVGKAATLFLFFCLLKPDVRSDLAGKMEGSTGRQRLNKSVLADRLIPKPPLEEQEEIARIFSVLQQKIEVAEHQREVLQSLFRTLLHELMTAKIRVTTCS